MDTDDSQQLRLMLKQLKKFKFLNYFYFGKGNQIDTFVEAVSKGIVTLNHNLYETISN